MQLGTEVRVGDVLVRLEPRELQFALDRAESGTNAELPRSLTHGMAHHPDE